MRSLRVAFALAAACGAVAAPAAAQQPPDPATVVRSAIEQVPSDPGHVRFGARDSAGTPLEGLKVIQTNGRNVGVYHAQVGGRYELYVGTSTDLLHWTKTATLDTDASQGTLAALSDGGYVVAYEWAKPADIVSDQHLSLLAPLTAVTAAKADRIRIRFRYYPTLDRLLGGQIGREFTAPRALSATAQGTPSITSAALTPDLSSSRIEVGLHYRADTDGNGYPDEDRQGTAVLTNFSSWRPRVAGALNTALASATRRSRGSSKIPLGSFGDRDEITFDGAPLQLSEVQYRRNDFSSWRLFLRDRRSGVLSAVRVATPGASTSFGNPTITELVAPSGKRALMVTMFVFSEGAASGEAGSLIFYRELS
ncbi:MAG: hypothetical protein QOE11_732 [Solirubrobacteraceae bacterium]|jgi:hypothetical protein|nr:hypothetical protein [Solirubrobacteraceae bacterium]